MPSLAPYSSPSLLTRYITDPSYTDLNHLIANTITGTTCSLRFTFDQTDTTNWYGAHGDDWGADENLEVEGAGELQYLIDGTITTTIATKVILMATKITPTKQLKYKTNDHPQQQQVHDGDDRWTENCVERQGPPTRPHSSNCSIPNSDPMMPDERMDYDYGNAQQYHHHQRRVHLSVTTGEVGRVSLTPPPSHTTEGFDESYHHPMKRQHHQHQ